MLALKAYWKNAGPRDDLRTALRVLLALVLVIQGCSGASGGGGPAAAAIAASRVHRQNDPERPRLTLVERDGDPQRGLALAVRVNDALSAATLSQLVESRLRSAGFVTATGQSSPSGFIVSALADDPESIAGFIRAGNRALLDRVSASEAERVSAKFRTSPLRAAVSTSEAALAECSGELVLPVNSGASVASALRVADWLAAIPVGDVAFAVVGPKSQLEIAADAVGELAAWSRHGAPARTAPRGDSVGIVPGPIGVLNLSVALWGVASAAAIASAEKLSEPDSLLSVRVAAGFPAWHVVRVASNLDRDGACLRVDLQSTAAAPSVEAVANSASSALAELDHSLQRLEPVSWVMAKQVLAMEGPHQAAAVAAWQALNRDTEERGAARRIIHYSGEIAGSVPASRLSELVDSRSAEARRAPLERKSGVESGQGKFWMLLATPCGTSAEDATTAGTLALALHATALAFNGRSGVTLEPWLNVDSMGLLAHAAAGAPHERPEAQAERVAEALARGLLSAGPPPELISQAREALMSGLAEGPTPTLSLALKQTSASHPSWLDPRGTWSTLSAISARSVQLERESFTRSKLRLASLGNVDEAQVSSGERRLLDLLGSTDAGRRECPTRGTVSPVAGRYRIEPSGPSDADAIVSIPLPTSHDGLPSEALWTELLMNRTDGWLEQALLRPGLVSTARARVMGGLGAAALVIELHALDGKREEAVAQIRGLLERLRAGAATAIDARAAAEYFERREAQRQLNPRARLVDLWRGRPREGATLESLRALHRLAFEAGREVVVLAEPSE